MSDTPLLSYIVLSYNYEHYIDQTIRSILRQTVQDFEIVVVDDCSKDNSVEVVRSFRDPRIRVLCNEKNLGGAGSYNRAVSAARGEWLVNLDADDWIAPHKAEAQLEFAAQNPHLDIIGSYVVFLDADGAPHPNAEVLEGTVNQSHEFGRVDTWVGTNNLCRSSVMMRRSAHMRIGLDDPNMARAPDYELWTRALREGCGIATVPEKLTYLRLHSSGVTHADPLGTLLEIAYAMLRNLVPVAERRSLYPTIQRILAWVCRHHELSRLLPIERYRLIGMMMQATEVGDFASFKAALSDPTHDAEWATTGRRAMALFSDGAGPYQDVRTLHKEVAAQVAAAEYWRQRSQTWEREYLNAAHAS
ncbi:glycosyltransferase family 2 protein [Paraburkholderia sediminicola]|nr:glycosyltransferase family 2 protein [Paraburkholderia sediminicola]